MRQLKVYITVLLLVQPTIARLQPVLKELTEVRWGIETSTAVYETRWVCSGQIVGTGMTRDGDTAWLYDGYWITGVEIPQALWSRFMADNPSAVKGDSYPVTNITRDSVEQFCQKLQRYSHHMWRLPTKEEWLWACRGGVYSEGYSYAGSNNSGFVAWSKENSGGKPHPVGQRIENEMHLYDMSGNVAEMVTDGDTVAFMGGSYMDRAKNLMAERRAMPEPEACGFRVVATERLWFDRRGDRTYVADEATIKLTK